MSVVRMWRLQFKLCEAPHPCRDMAGEKWQPTMAEIDAAARVNAANFSELVNSFIANAEAASAISVAPSWVACEGTLRIPSEHRSQCTLMCTRVHCHYGVALTLGTMRRCELHDLHPGSAYEAIVVASGTAELQLNSTLALMYIRHAPP